MSSDETISVTIPDAVRATGIARSKLYDLLGTGEIEAVKLGRRTLIRTESLRRYVSALPAAKIGGRGSRRARAAAAAE